MKIGSVACERMHFPRLNNVTKIKYFEYLIVIQNVMLWYYKSGYISLHVKRNT